MHACSRELVKHVVHIQDEMESVSVHPQCVPAVVFCTCRLDVRRYEVSSVATNYNVKMPISAIPFSKVASKAG